MAVFKTRIVNFHTELVPQSRPQSEQCLGRAWSPLDLRFDEHFLEPLCQRTQLNTRTEFERGYVVSWTLARHRWTPVLNVAVERVEQVREVALHGHHLRAVDQVFTSSLIGQLFITRLLMTRAFQSRRFEVRSAPNGEVHIHVVQQLHRRNRVLSRADLRARRVDGATAHGGHHDVVVLWLGVFLIAIVDFHQDLHHFLSVAL